MATTSPTQRTMKKLRADGYKPAIVEKFNKFAGPHGIRQDMFGIIDIVAIRPGEILGVQSCGQAFSEHMKKLTLECFQDCEDWLEAGGRLELWGWRKLKVKRGGKAMVWTPRIKVFTLLDFIPTWQR